MNIFFFFFFFFKLLIIQFLIIIFISHYLSSYLFSIFSAFVARKVIKVFDAVY